MARIVIKDLQESIELDRKAMKNIRGGARGIGGGDYRHRVLVQHPRTAKPRLFSNK